MENMRGLYERDFRTIDAYRKAYTMKSRAGYLNEEKSEYFVSSESWLSPWKENKSEFLFKLFGEGNLILERPVHFDRDLEMEIERFKQTDAYNDFFFEFRSKVNANNNIASTSWTDLCFLLASHHLATNRLSSSYGTINFYDGSSLTLSKNDKVSKILGKIANKFGCEKYEAFRLAHSAVLNSKKTTGTLCLSIHPMDYLTMSDNACDWHSCMSWIDSGCYRMGTIEMMNSPCVVVAYIKEEKNRLEFDDFSWNSKKWRSLYIVNKDIITNIKGYPYQLEDIDTIVIKWIAELAQKNLGIEYPYSTVYDVDTDYTKQYSIEYWIETKFMYNDYYYNNVHQVLASVDKMSNTTYNISGPAMCAWCGDIIENDEEDDDHCPNLVICSACLPRIRCAECGDLCFEGDSGFHYCNGDYYCDACYNRCFETVINDTKEMLRCDVKYLVIIPSEYEPYMERGMVDNQIIASDVCLRFPYNPEIPIDNFISKIANEGIAPHTLWNCYGKPIKYLYSDEVNDNIIEYKFDTSRTIGRTMPITADGKFDRIKFAINDLYWLFEENYNYWFQYINKVKATAEKENRTDYVELINQTIQNTERIKKQAIEDFWLFGNYEWEKEELEEI